MNALRKAGNLKTNKTTDARKKARVIYIEADKDHIHLQNGKAGMVKLIYVIFSRKTPKNPVTK
ncbi:hypothetical protein DXT63_02815 [Thermoanaerobacteraceae bacterium SP2]|jgi:hypothetical protein|nr:hypothetical protein DXT63_02815 [Thermoanaerobacteraceae bacterium SP2]